MSYTETGVATTDIANFMGTGDAYLEDIHTLRNQYQADVCILLVESLDNSGWAGAIGAGFTNAFCVVKDEVAISNYSFPHELVHLFGGRHQFPVDPASGDAHGKAFVYNNDNYDSKSFRTIMAIESRGQYDGESYNHLIPRRVGYFSNPLIDEPVSDEPTGDEHISYVASKIDSYASTLAALQPIVTSGTITKDEWWAGTINITGDVTVGSGKTLTILPGAIINFASGKKLIVNGTLYAEDATLTSASSSVTWGGVQYNSGSTGTILYSEVKNASTGVTIDEAGQVYLRYNKINDCTTGVEITDDSPWLYGNEIFNNDVGVSAISYAYPQFGSFLYKD